MTIDRHGVRLAVGDTVRLTRGMPIGRVRKAEIVGIDGEDVTVRCDLGAAGGIVLGHRYPNEMEKL